MYYFADGNFRCHFKKVFGGTVEQAVSASNCILQLTSMRGVVLRTAVITTVTVASFWEFEDQKFLQAFIILIFFYWNR